MNATSPAWRLLDDFLRPLGMLAPRGPLHAMADLVRGILFTASVQLSNAGRLIANSPRPLRRVVDRLSDHLADRNWNHGEWAAAVLQRLANRSERGHAVTLPVQLPVCDVAQSGGPVRLWLVVSTCTFVRDNKEERWMLLTRGLIDQQVGPRQTRYDYALRWRAEDGKRMLGQIWHVERFMTRSFLALERMLWCVCLPGGFLAMLQREEPALCQRLEGEVLYHDKQCKIPGCHPSRSTTRGGCPGTPRAHEVIHLHVHRQLVQQARRLVLEALPHQRREMFL